MVVEYKEIGYFDIVIKIWLVKWGFKDKLIGCFFDC